MIFTGAVTYKVNFDAGGLRLVTAIWPLVLGQVSQAVFTVTGSTGGVDVAQLAEAPEVRFSGYLGTYAVVRGSWACVVPLLQGGGTRLKILEAMALGTPVISTSKGVEGLDVTPGLNILLADDAIVLLCK